MPDDGRMTPDRAATSEQPTERRGRVELRWTRSGEFDEFVVYDQAGKCIVHGESMSEGTYWIGLYMEDGERAVVNFRAAKKGALDVEGHWEE